MLDFYIGKRKNVAHASYLIARDIYIQADPAQMVELDGEVKLETPFQTSVVPAAIQIRYAA